MIVECEKEGYETAKANLESEFVGLTLRPELEIIEASAKPAPPEAPWIWRTMDNNVLAYSEIDGKGASLKMPTHVDLNLKLLQGIWGMFEYDAESGTRRQGWILMENVGPKL